MEHDRHWRWLPVPGCLAGSLAHAAPIEGELGSNAAALLVLLGVWALFMGMRNLRELRHKRLIPERQMPVDQAADREEELTDNPG